MSRHNQRVEEMSWNAYPIGSLLMLNDKLVTEDWVKADGSRVYRKDNPELYHVLKTAGFHKKWRRWIVFLPNFVKRNRKAPNGLDNYSMRIKVRSSN